MRVGVENGSGGGTIFTGSASDAAVFGTISNSPVQLFQNNILRIQIPTAQGLSGQFLQTNGAGVTVWAAAGGSSTWDTIGAAAGDGTTANGTNRIVYQTAPTADSRIAWRFTESAAATNGTSTSGVPNQVLLRVDTLAASTQSPLSVYSRGSFVFAVSPTAVKILVASASTPVYSFAAATTGGLGFDGSGVAMWSGNGTKVFILNNASITQAAAQDFTAPFICNNSSGVNGFSFSNSGTANVGVSVDDGTTNGVENSRWIYGAYQLSKGTADAVAYALNFRKSRGTVASPTVITTGDVLSTVSGYAYLGATNTYRETARIEVTSKGTISDATNGVGSIVTFYGKTQGTDVTVQPTVIITDGSTATVRFPTYTAATFVGGDKYLVIDANGNIHVSAVGPAS